LRLELYNDVNDYIHNGEVFAVLYERVRQLLENNVNVIIDDTNLMKGFHVIFTSLITQ